MISHKWLKGSPYYAIDMEFCEFTLADCIQGDRMEQTLVEMARRDETDVHRNVLPGENQKWIGICNILKDICHGVGFIHDCNEVHRDLKPSNGESAVYLSLSTSPLFTPIVSLEDRRLWIHL